MPIPTLELRTLIASQTESIVYQAKTKDLETVYPTLFATASAPESDTKDEIAHNSGVVMSVWPKLSPIMESLRIAVSFPKCAVKVSTNATFCEASQDKVIAADQGISQLLHECVVMAHILESSLTTSTSRPIADRIPIPIGVILFRSAEGILRAALIESYIKACPLQNLFYRYPTGITTVSNGKPTINFCRDTLFQIAHIMGILAGLNVVYRDLKLPNVLVDCCGKVTLIDFGHAFVANQHQERCKSPATFHTSAPELFSTRQNIAALTLADLWSFGVLMYELIFARRIDTAAREIFGGSESELWWKQRGVYNSDALLSDSFCSSELSSGRASLSTTNDKVLLLQLKQAQGLIETLLTTDPIQRQNRLRGLCSNSEHLDLWSIVLSQPFFKEATGWSNPSQNVDEDLEDEVDMQTLGM